MTLPTPCCEVAGVVIPTILAPTLVMDIQVVTCAAMRVLAAIPIPFQHEQPRVSPEGEATSAVPCPFRDGCFCFCEVGRFFFQIRISPCPKWLPSEREIAHAVEEQKST